MVVVVGVLLLLVLLPVVVGRASNVGARVIIRLKFVLESEFRFGLELPLLGSYGVFFHKDFRLLVFLHARSMFGFLEFSLWGVQLIQYFFQLQVRKQLSR